MTDCRYSIVIEWENALNASESRGVRMLQTLAEQIAQFSDPGAFELILVYDPAEFSEQALAQLMQSTLGNGNAALRLKLLGSVNPGYYANKNEGASQALGDWVVFLDSDVIPEHGWLEQLLMDHEERQSRAVMPVRVGCAYIEPTGLVGKTFAMTWFFPLRSEDGPPRRVKSFFANNLALHRDIIGRFPFPILKGTSRGGCIALAQQFVEAGIVVCQVPRARVMHPAPNGWRHFRDRALAQGRDRLAREKINGNRWSRSWLGSCGRLLRHWAQCGHNILTKYRKVGLHPLAIPAAGVISCAYYFLYFCGETASHLGMDAIKRVRI